MEKQRQCKFSECFDSSKVDDPFSFINGINGCCLKSTIEEIIRDAAKKKEGNIDAETVRIFLESVKADWFTDDGGFFSSIIGTAAVGKMFYSTGYPDCVRNEKK